MVLENHLEFLANSSHVAEETLTQIAHVRKSLALIGQLLHHVVTNSTPIGQEEIACLYNEMAVLE